MTKSKVRKAVLPVAGLGTRFLPITKAIPKEMLSIVDRPIIQFIVDEAFASGIEQIIFVNGHHKSSIEDYFDINYELNDALSRKGEFAELASLEELSSRNGLCSVRQKAALGLGHAVLCARHLIGNEPFAVMLGDDLIFTKKGERPAIGQLIDAYEHTGLAQVALMRVNREEIHKYGAAEGSIDANNSRYFSINNLIEKPKKGTEKTEFAVVGRYILTPNAWPILEELDPGEGGEIQLTDGLYRLMASEGLNGLLFLGHRVDAGDRIGYLRANIMHALSREELREDAALLIRELNAKNY